MILKSNHTGRKHSNTSHEGLNKKPNLKTSDNTEITAKISVFTTKLLNAIVTFILKSVNLHTVTIDSMKIQPDFLKSFGEALVSTKSGINFAGYFLMNFEEYYYSFLDTNIIVAALLVVVLLLLSKLLLLLSLLSSLLFLITVIINTISITVVIIILIF